MNSQHSKSPAAALSLVFAICVSLSGCNSSSSYEYAEAPSPYRSLETESSHAEEFDPGYDSYSDIPTPYPGLYQHDADSGWQNTYDESRVIGYKDARNYVGQDATVEGTVSSVIYAGSSNGFPHFFNMGEGEFAAIVWSQDVADFDQILLHNYVEWSKSGQPITVTFRISGTVEMYEGRPQITARDGSQIATLSDDGTWYTFMSDEAIDNLMRQRYQ